ncbi:helix-turn-helix domain-containing protein [Peribacillus frigoritolerans]|uniref:helix-turn-helix domain-containing protein n=1 Tax=Peribacillus TaxID=2675229 RepID=UPI003337DBD1
MAKRFKELKLKNDYSMQAIGEKAGVGKSSIAAYESGEKKPTTDRLKVIADIFEVSTDYLLGNSDAPHTKKQTKNLAILLKESVFSTIFRNNFTCFCWVGNAHHNWFLFSITCPRRDGR